jgi:hypothetical protein
MSHIRTLLDFTNNGPVKAVTRGNAVYSGMNGNPSFPSPPVDMPTLRTGIDTVSAAMGAALDRGKKATTLRDDQTETLIRMLRQLAHYVEACCKDDLNIFVSSGFQPISQARTGFQPLSQFIRRIDHGDNSGELDISLATAPGALSYELRWAPLVNGAAGTWTSRLAATTRPPISLSNLTPGTTYAFEVRVLTNTGYSDWSDAVTQMCL